MLPNRWKIDILKWAGYFHNVNQSVTQFDQIYISCNNLVIRFRKHCTVKRMLLPKLQINHRCDPRLGWGSGGDVVVWSPRHQVQLSEVLCNVGHCTVVFWRRREWWRKDIPQATSHSQHNPNITLTKRYRLLLAPAQGRRIVKWSSSHDLTVCKNA